MALKVHTITECKYWLRKCSKYKNKENSNKIGIDSVRLSSNLQIIKGCIFIYLDELYS